MILGLFSTRFFGVYVSVQRKLLAGTENLSRMSSRSNATLSIFKVTVVQSTGREGLQKGERVIWKEEVREEGMRLEGGSKYGGSMGRILVESME